MVVERESRIVINLISTFGCITRKQIEKIFEGSRFDVNKQRKMISFLINSRQAKTIEDEYVAAQTVTTPDKHKLDCIWVMLDRMQAPISEHDEIMFARSSEYDSLLDLCYVKDNKTIENVLFVNKMSLTNKVVMIQQTHKSSTTLTDNDKQSIVNHYIFVVRDEETMEKLARLKLDIPFIVAFIEGDATGVPTIEYYMPE